MKNFSMFLLYKYQQNLFAIKYIHKNKINHFYFKKKKKSFNKHIKTKILPILIKYDKLLKKYLEIQKVSGLLQMLTDECYPTLKVL